MTRIKRKTACHNAEVLNAAFGAKTVQVWFDDTTFYNFPRLDFAENSLPQRQGTEFCAWRQNRPSLVRCKNFLQLPVIRIIPKTAYRDAEVLNSAFGAKNRPSLVPCNKFSQLPVIPIKRKTACDNAEVLNSAFGA